MVDIARHVLPPWAACKRLGGAVGPPGASEGPHLGPRRLKIVRKCFKILGYFKIIWGTLGVFFILNVITYLINEMKYMFFY